MHSFKLFQNQSSPSGCVLFVYIYIKIADRTVFRTEDRFLLRVLFSKFVDACINVFKERSFKKLYFAPALSESRV